MRSKYTRLPAVSVTATAVDQLFFLPSHNPPRRPGAVLPLENTRRRGTLPAPGSPAPPVRRHPRARAVSLLLRLRLFEPVGRRRRRTRQRRDLRAEVGRHGDLDRVERRPQLIDVARADDPPRD